ncbi:MAG: hypothetical protein M3R52_10770 [Acidobacteriota bacterium]|nr:hypothetical protein [Acidobacteriota bacterium]
MLSSATIYTQTPSTVTGRWVWKQIIQRNKPQTQFTLVIDRKGDVVRGVYSVDEFINGKWQGEDGNQTPFSGRVKGSTIELEFDPSATVAGYEQNVTYARPKEGRKPSTAILTLSGPTLQWRLVTGPGIEGAPAKLILKREQTKAKSKR